MPDISKYLKQAEELDKKRGISSNPSVMPAVTPGGAVTQTAGPDISAYLAQAEKLDRERSAAPTTTPNTTRADGAGVGGNGYEIQMPKLEVNALGAGGGAREGGNLWDRIRDTLSGGIKQSVGGNVDTMGTMYEATQGQRDTLYDQQREWTAHQLARAEADLAAYTADGNAYMAKVTQGEVERLRTQLNAYDTVKQGQVQQKATTAARDMAAQVTQSGAQDIERAKEGLGLVGQALVDVGASGVQMLGDAGLGALTGVGGLAPMAFRAFGGGTQKARAEGADLDKQILYGGAQAAKEWVTEKLFSVALPFAKTYGKGSLDDVVEKSISKAVDRFAKSALGKRALGGGLTLGAAALGEGLEEGLGTFLEWQLPRIYGGDVASFGETLEEAAYNTLVGSLSGLAGGVVTPQVWNYQQAEPQTAQGGAEAAQEAQNAPVTGNETPTPAEGAQRPQNTPVSFENTAAADILMGAAPQKQRAGFTSLENAMANQFERETGISIESVESILGGLANGDYNSANWVARIAQDAKDPKMVVVAHELTHHLQTLAPQEYESFRTAVADYFTRAGGEAALTDMMNRYRSAYGAAGQNLSDSAVMDEMAADFTEVLLTDADLFGQFARENRTLAERLLDALRAFIEKIRATFTGRARDAAAQEATGKTLNELEMIAEQWQGVYRAAAAAYGQNANTATQEGDGVVRYKRAGMADKNVVSIKKQIDAARNMLNQMAPVFSKPVDVNLKEMTVPQKRAWAEAEIKKAGSIIDRQGYGTILIAPSDINEALNYIKDDGTIEAFPAVPAILRRGVEIYRDVNHKMRGYDTVTFAGPVEINGVRGNMAVVVRETGKNRYDMHRIVLPDGSAFEFVEKANAVPTTVGGITEDAYSSGEVAPTINTAPDIRLPNLSDGVKGNMAQLKSTAPLRQMMAEMPQQMMIRMPRLTIVEQDGAEAAGVEAAPVEDTVQLPQLGLTDADVPGTEPLTRQDIARELAWRARMANEPAAPQAMGEVKLPDLSADMEEAGMGVADFTGNVETVPQEATAEILSALEELSRDMEAPMETPTDATVRDAENLISAETVEAPQSLKEKAAESWAFFKRKMVDSGEAVTQIGKAINDKYLYPFYNMARASASAGANMIAEEQTDVNGRPVGESLNAIFDPIRAKGEEYYTQFQTYMYDLHNIARMSMDQKAKQEQETAEAALAAYTADHPKFINMTEAQAQRQADSIDELEAEEAQEYLRLVRWVNRAARMGNKPVFDYDFTAEMSRGRSERLLREHPEFAQYREQVRKYIDNMMQYRVDSGLITQQDADFLRKYYPDYIPTYRRQEFEDFGAAVKKKRVQIGKTVGRATGGNTKLVPLHEALGKQTMQVVREGSKNRFGARLLQDYTANASNADIARYVRNAEEYESDFSIDTFDSIDDVKPKRGNTFSVYLGGKLYDMTVDNALFEAVEALSPTATEQNTVTKVVHDINKLYKALITGYNPTFAIRNTVRDLQTAGLYSRDFAAWAKNYPKALAEIKNDGPMWKQYKALGGDFSSVFDYMTGTVKKPTTKAGKVMDKVQALNMAMEQAPRLAEFMAVMESGDGSMESAMDAMLAAADVTVNFGRGGTWGKMLNANYVPFLNPGIQGFDKMVRYATQSRSGKQWLMMAARAAALGIAPSLINALLYHDDEEWEELRDSDKDTNYMFKLKDGMWLKIPKGRELSVLGIAADRVGDALQGEEVDIRATLNTMANQVAPANPLNQNILKAAYDTQLFDPSSPGRTWYGGDIEGQRLQNYAPGERYDSSTDVVSKAVGGALNLSPKKLNYLADQYTGVVGDIVLPLLTPQAERDMFSKAFTVDSISSNELSGKFYEKSDELTYAKNGGDAVAAVVSRYWNSISSDVSKLYGEIRNVENSNLSNREKKEQVQELQRQINAIQREALATVDQYTAAVESSLFGDDEDAADFAYRETNREVFGAKSALETYNKDVYAKAQEAAKNGVSYEAYYDYYFATKDIEGDKDASGKTIPGSKREKVLAEINAMDLTVEQKNALYYASGYAESALYEAPWYTIQMPRL